MTLVVLFFAFAFALFASSVHAQDATPSSTSKESPSTTLGTSEPTFEVSQTLPLPSTVSPTSPLYTDLIVNNMFHTFSCLMIGGSVIGQPCLTYQVQQNAEGVIQTVPVLSQVNLSGGALGATTSLIGALYANPPLRTADYIGSIGEQLGIVKTANAQVIGSGNAVLSPILSLWQVSRNIAYLAMIVVFIIIGLMVLFRNRINPQTVITAQAALPGLVIGLILITFSYFLAALISDTAFIGTNLVGYYFSSAIDPSKPQNLLQDLETPGSDGRKENVIKTFSRFAGQANKEKVTAILDSFWDDLHPAAKGLLTMLAVFVSSQVAGQATELVKAIPIFGEPIQAIIQVAAGAGAALDPKAAAGFLLAFVVTAILLYAMFKLLLRLVSAFLSIIFLTITAPFHFLAAALPGRQGIATSWILNMLANVLAFPAIIAVFYFVAFILGPSNAVSEPNLQFGPYRVPSAYLKGTTADSSIVSVAQAQGQSSSSIVGTNAFPLFGGMNLSFIKLLLAFGALVAAPSIPDIIARTIGRVGQAGQLIGQEIGGSVSAGRGYGQQFQQGVGGASGQFARARGLFDTPQYTIAGYHEGEPVYKLNPFQSTVGGLGKFKTWRQGGKEVWNPNK